MVFGAQKNQGLGSIKSALRDEGAISERMRLQHIKEEREKHEAQQAKMSLLDKKRQLERNTHDLSRRQIELRRLTAEIARAELLFHEMERDIASYEEQMSVLQRKHADMLFQIDTHKKQVGEHQETINKHTRTVQTYEQEIHILEQKMNRERDIIHQIHVDIEHLGVRIAHLTNDATKAQTEVAHSRSNRMYKEKELENRKRTYAQLMQKKDQEQHEITRLSSLNSQLEREIQNMERQQGGVSRIH
jgi:chromosome segregation ATPase